MLFRTCNYGYTVLTFLSRRTKAHTEAEQWMWRKDHDTDTSFRFRLNHASGCRRDMVNFFSTGLPFSPSNSTCLSFIYFYISILFSYESFVSQTRISLALCCHVNWTQYTNLNSGLLLHDSILTVLHVEKELTFRHRASCILGQAFRYSTENAFYIFNQQIYFIIWYLLDRASLI